MLSLQRSGRSPDTLILKTTFVVTLTKATPAPMPHHSPHLRHLPRQQAPVRHAVAAPIATPTPPPPGSPRHRAWPACRLPRSAPPRAGCWKPPRRSRQNGWQPAQQRTRRNRRMTRPGNLHHPVRAPRLRRPRQPVAAHPAQPWAHPWQHQTIAGPRTQHSPQPRPPTRR